MNPVHDSLSIPGPERCKELESTRPSSHHKLADAAYISCGIAFSLGPSQIVSPIWAAAHAISTVWDSISIATAVYKGYHLKNRNIRLQGSTALSEEEELELSQLQQQMEKLKIDRFRSIENLQQDAHSLISALIGIIPFFGLLGSGSYLSTTRKRSTHIHASQVESGAEAISEEFASKLPFITSRIRQAFYYLSGTSSEDFLRTVGESSKEYFHQLLENMQAEALIIPVERENEQVHSITGWFINTNQNESQKTMILFHGNAMTALALLDIASFYFERQWNVLIFTYGGYPGSDEGVITSEISTIQDTHAVLRYIEKKGVETIGVHGLSLGGTLALHATQLSHRVKLCIVDKTFDTPSSVAVNLSNNLSRTYRPLCLIPSAIVGGIAATAFPTRKPVHGVRDKEGRIYFTDGNNNLDKAARYDGIFLACGAQRDLLMGYGEGDELFGYTRNLAYDLYEAHLAYKGHLEHSFLAIDDQHHSPMLGKNAKKIIKEILKCFLEEKEE